MEESRKGKTIKSAFDSTYFERNVEIRVDRKVGSATISPSGRDVALASSNGLDIIDLDNPLNPPRHLRHRMTGLVSDVQWSPFAVRDYWVASTANQKALVWNLNLSENKPQGPIEHTLHGHSRAITDINFSAHHPDMLATCAVDGYVHCWDLRRSRQPVLTFCDWFAGATQVKYNRQDSHILASSHDRWLRIWDDRKGAEPLRSINAHESKIYGVDWNRTRATGIITCSLDKSIKFWDYENDLDEPERIIRTDFPVWRARHTPFGWGVLAMPQDTPGNLHLYERRLQSGMEKECHAPAITTFLGHGDHKVKEFLWRPRGGITDDGVDNREFQLVTWGEDNCLRLHHVDSDSLAGVGYVKGSQVRKKLNVTRKGAVYKTFRSVENSSSDKKLPTISGPRPGSSGLKAGALTMGPKRINLPYISHSGIVRAPAMKGKGRSSKHDDQTQPQIEWMSGIKILKHDAQTATRRSNSRRLSFLNPDFDEDWDASENLHDEIIRIHEQLPKITFNDVNMDKRTIIASMNGPWGDDRTPIHITVTIVFPEQYPESKAPNFTLGKSSLLQEEIYNKLRREVQQIASGFVARKQGCLEATLCYLLGEVDLETSTTFFKDFLDLDDDLDALADESSSDDDGNIPNGASIMMSQELDSSAADSMLTPGNRNANVPLPRLCGARFSANGKLACFFPPKEDKVKSLLETFVSKNNARLKGQPIFENFGRLHNNSSPIPRIKTMSTTSESRTDSDASDVTDYSSSSDSDSTRFPPRFQMSAYFRKDRRPYRKRSPTLLSQRSSAGGTGTGTGTGTGFGRFRPSKPKNIIVTLYQIAALLPSKIELADDYAVFGDGPKVCEQNARAAEKHGYSDIADVWRYAAILLNNEIPLEVFDQNRRNVPVFIIAKDALRHKRSNSGSDSGLDLTFDLHRRSRLLSGRVKWGTSPLARQLISDLFAHFEATADIQMLAMLSCVFNEPSAEDAALQVDMPMTQTPISMKTPAFSLAYFPTDAAAWNMYRKTQISSVVSTPKFPQTPTGYYGSVGSSNAGVWGSDPVATSLSCGETPPLRSSNASNEHLNRQTQSLSTSPDNSRSFRRANSGLASSFAASFSRPFSMTSSSPPNPLNRKRPSPVENIMNSLAPSAITWGNTTVLGSVKEQTPVERFSYSDNENSKNVWNPTVCTGISLSVQNQSNFDDEGCMSTSLLDTSHAMLYASYRRAYAELLYLWRHPLSRLEVLKFNGLTDYFFGWDETETKSFAASIKSNDTYDTAREDASPSPILLGKNRQPPSIQIEEGLDVAGFCLKHETRLETHVSDTSGGAVGRCDRCQVIQRQLCCVICAEPVSALFSPCLSCGCVTHEHCLDEYHDDEDTYCPGGCDCDCGQKASAGLVETWEVMMGAIENMRMLEEKNRVKPTENKDAIDEWEERSDWEHLSSPPVSELVKPYNSLSTRLGQVRTGDWGVSGGKKKPSSLRHQEML